MDDRKRANIRNMDQFAIAPVTGFLVPIFITSMGLRLESGAAFAIHGLLAVLTVVGFALKWIFHQHGDEPKHS